MLQKSPRLRLTNARRVERGGTQLAMSYGGCLFAVRKPVKATDSWNVLVGTNLSIVPPLYFPMLYCKQTSCIMYKAPRMKMQGRTPIQKLLRISRRQHRALNQVWEPSEHEALCDYTGHLSMKPVTAVNGEAHPPIDLFTLLTGYCWTLGTKKVGHRRKKEIAPAEVMSRLLW